MVQFDITQQGSPAAANCNFVAHAKHADMCVLYSLNILVLSEHSWFDPLLIVFKSKSTQVCIHQNCATTIIAHTCAYTIMVHLLVMLYTSAKSQVTLEQL